MQAIKARRWLRVLAATSALIVLFGLWLHWYGQRLPHAGLVFIGSALDEYARKHGGRFPAGERTPELSLMLLCDRDTLVSAVFKDTLLYNPQEAAEPKNCKWHYVEGLTLADDPSLAVVWEDRPAMGVCRQVLFV